MLYRYEYCVGAALLYVKIIYNGDELMKTLLEFMFDEVEWQEEMGRYKFLILKKKLGCLQMFYSLSGRFTARS